MSDHVKPTSEELDKGIQENIEKLDKMEDQEEKENEEIKQKADAINDDEQKTDDKDDENKENADEDGGDDDQSAKKEADGQKDEATTDEQKDSKEKEQEVDWKKRYSDSTREAQIIAAKERKMQAAYDKAAELPEPTKEELRTEFPEWDNLSDHEKKVAKRTLHNDRRFAVIDETREEFKNIEAWNKRVDEFTEDPKTLTDNPDLEGKIDDFKVFATKDSRRGADFEILVKSFLFDVEKERVKHKGKMFETGTGGPKEKRAANDKLSLDDSAKLMQSDYKKWRELLKAGKITMSVE